MKKAKTTSRITVRQPRKFVGIIGNSNAGKSTIIKSLTGCKDTAFRGFVTDNSTNRCIYVICSSPQEGAVVMSLVDLQNILVQCVANPNCLGLVMAIQPTRPRTRLSMEDIFSEVTKTGNFSRHAFILAPARNGKATNPDKIAARLNLPTLNPNFPQPIILDGRRFSMLNAQIINSITQIVI
jgi:energy-coupling factor transporter ATP-binding protein EcfA2